MLFKDKTAFTSDPITLRYRTVVEAYVTVTGVATVVIEQLEEDGVWRSFPETTFVGPTAQRVDLKRGDCRVKVTSGTATVGLYT